MGEGKALKKEEKKEWRSDKMWDRTREDPKAKKKDCGKANWSAELRETSKVRNSEVWKERSSAEPKERM